MACYIHKVQRCLFVKFKKSQLLFSILIVLIMLIIGAGIFLKHNFNLIGQFDDGGYTGDSFILGDYAYIADGSDGLEIIDISDPTAPTEVGQYDDGGWVYSVFILESYAYITEYDYGLKIIDISDPTAPTEVGQYFLGHGRALGLYVSGSYAYVASFSDGMLIFDISNPNTPMKVGQFDECGIVENVFIVGDYAYVPDGYSLKIVEISDPTKPTEVGQFDYDHGGLIDVYVSGSYAYAAEGSAGLGIIDISNPAAPTKVGQINDGGRIFGVFVSGSYAYLADYDEGLGIIDISNPTAPVEVRKLYDLGQMIRYIYVSGSYVYIMGSNIGMEIIDPWSSKEIISNIILWSIICICILLFLVDLRYFIKDVFPIVKKNGEKLVDQYTEQPLKIFFHFLIGFVFSTGLVILYMLLIFLGVRNFEVWWFLTVITFLTIFAVVLKIFFKHRLRYISIGMIAGIFGPLFLIIKRNGEKLVDQYTEHPKKKRSHFIIGLMLSIGLLILYLSIIYFALMMVRPDLWHIVIVYFILLNIFIGLLKFFSKEKLLYISKGLIPLSLVAFLLIGFVLIMLKLTEMPTVTV